MSTNIRFIFICTVCLGISILFPNIHQASAALLCERPISTTDNTGGNTVWDNNGNSWDTTSCPGGDTTTEEGLSNNNLNNDTAIDWNWATANNSYADLKVKIRITTSSFSKNTWAFRYTTNGTTPNSTNGTLLTRETTQAGTCPATSTGKTNGTCIYSATISSSQDLTNLKVGFSTIKSGGGDGASNIQTYDVWVEGNEPSATAPTVTTSAASSVGSSTATINGTISATGGANATARGFAWGTSASLSGGDTATTSETGSFGTGAFANARTGLSPHTTYYARAYATNSGGTGSGSIINFLTLPGIPGTPTYTNIATSSVTISWTAPSGGATSYKLDRCTVADCSSYTQVYSNSSLAFTDTGLSASTNYWYRVRGGNTTGDGAYSSISNVETAASPYPPSGTLTCAVTTTCPTGTIIYNISSTSTGHAELPNQSNYQYFVCCTGVAGLSNSCAADVSTTTIKLSDATNASVEQNTFSNYTYNACMGVPSGGSVYVAYQENDCTGYDTTLGSMSATTNADIGDSTAYSTKICATASGAPSSLAVEMVDAGGAPISSPSIALSVLTFLFDYQTSSGSFGDTSQKMRIINTTTNPQWSLSIAATDGATALWTDSGKTYDFNDNAADAEDGGDTDTVGGQLSLNPTAVTITPQSGCSTTGLSLGGAASFIEGTTNSITLITAGSSSDLDCHFDLTDLPVTQTIPQEQLPGNYSINMTLSIVAI